MVQWEAAAGSGARTLEVGLERHRRNAEKAGVVSYPLGIGLPKVFTAFASSQTLAKAAIGRSRAMIQNENLG